ncbi:MAG TPA: hypothetical protein VIY07_07900, partial [Pseudolabrys sp.]
RTLDYLALIIRRFHHLPESLPVPSDFCTLIQFFDGMLGASPSRSSGRREWRFISVYALEVSDLERLVVERLVRAIKPVRRKRSLAACRNPIRLQSIGRHRPNALLSAAN